MGCMVQEHRYSLTLSQIRRRVNLFTNAQQKVSTVLNFFKYFSKYLLALQIFLTTA